MRWLPCNERHQLIDMRGEADIENLELLFLQISLALRLGVLLPDPRHAALRTFVRVFRLSSASRSTASLRQPSAAS